MDKKDKVEFIKYLLQMYTHKDTEIVFSDNVLSVYVSRMDELYRPSKVKLPKAAYEWMEDDTSTFETKLIHLLHNYAKPHQKLTDIEKYLNSMGSVVKLVNAYKYGYELEETEEERIKRGIEEVIKNHFPSTYIGDIDKLTNDVYNIVRGDKE